MSIVKRFWYALLILIAHMNREISENVKDLTMTFNQLDLVTFVEHPSNKMRYAFFFRCMMSSYQDRSYFGP